MPFPRQAQGRPGTVVIPPSWGEEHAKVVDRALSTASTVKIGPAGGESHWDEGLGRTVTAAAASVYDGPAELGLVTDTARALTVVEDPIRSRVYDVTLPAGAGVGIQIGHVIFVKAGGPDSTLSGRDLKVSAIERGSRRFSRVLLAVLLD